MPNRVLPENLRFEPALLACSKGARLFFLHLWMCVDDYRRAPVGPSPSNPTVLRSMCHPAETDIRIPDVARWLNELSLAGAVAIHDSDRGWYVEIADRLWYRREDYQEGQPKYGPRKPKVPEQQNLPMPGMINLVERPNVPSRKVPIQTQSESKPETNSRSRSAQGPDDDDNKGVPEMEAALRAAGGNLATEDRNWRKRCERMGWSTDEESWRRWLVQAVRRKPRVPAKPAPKPSVAMPSNWKEFIHAHYAGSPLSLGDLWANAQAHPRVLLEYQTWSNHKVA